MIYRLAIRTFTGRFVCLGLCRRRKPEDGGPLAGVTVYVMAINLPGPAAAARLTALRSRPSNGAAPPSGDPMQMFSRTGSAQLHAGQDMVTADLKAEEGWPFCTVLAGRPTRHVVKAIGTGVGQPDLGTTPVCRDRGTSG